MGTVIFTKTLSETDVKKNKTAVPMAARENDEVFRQVFDDRGFRDLEVFDDAGKRWGTFRLYARPPENEVYPKPIFSRGFRKFAEEKGLRDGDEVTFSRYQYNEAGGYWYYKIDYKRKGQPSIPYEQLPIPYNQPPGQTQIFTVNGEPMMQESEV